jgi:peptidoglycan/LPS O-acetylase OafA/YrhL
MPTRASSDYIPEIDSLRAIAVSLVVGFHAFPALLPGGFIGVDVFFVISGFVISRVYLDALVTRRIALSDFYAARFRRLAPAMLLVLVATTIASALVLEPDRLLSYAWSLAAQPLFLQNFVFWVEGDYFSGAYAKPLLHTWSLAVEEQFYVFWAVLILFFRRYPRAIVASVLVLAAVSLCTGFLLEPRSPKTVFYMFPTRVWQFALGILAFVAVQRARTLPNAWTALLSYVSVSLVLATAVLFDESSRLPGSQSIAACIATAAALFVFARAEVSPRLFRMAPVLYLGRISYGLYLWHWPPLVLFYLGVQRAPTPLEAVGLILIALGAACLSYGLVEQPIRERRFAATSRQLLQLIVAGIVISGTAAIVLISTRGLLLKYPKEIQPLFAAFHERGQFRCDRLYALMNPRSEACPLNKNPGPGGVLILGDSHADVLKELLADIGASQGLPVYLTTRNCDLGTYKAEGFCGKRILDEVSSQMSARGVTDVVAISLWKTNRFDGASLKADVQRLVAAGMRVHLMQVVPSDPTYDPRLRARQALAGKGLDLDGIPLERYLQTTRPEREIFEQVLIAFPASMSLLSPAKYLCQGTQCAWQARGVPYYLDSNHLTFAGSAALRPMFTQLFDAIAARGTQHPAARQRQVGAD